MEVISSSWWFYSFIDSSENYIKTRTFEGFCALHLAASQGHWKVVQVLLEAGADPNATTFEETTPLFLAVENGQIDALRLLLRHGANVNGSHSMCGWNALHQATFQVTAEFIISSSYKLCVLPF